MLTHLKHKTPKSKAMNPVSIGFDLFNIQAAPNIQEKGKHLINGRNQLTTDLVRAFKLKSRKIYLLEIEF
jgi:hypothetical protein